MNDSPAKNSTSDYIVLFLIFLFAFIFAFNIIGEPDTFWHLGIGRYILTTHSIPEHDVFSYTLPNTPFYRVEWLFDVVWYLLYSLFGAAGLIVMKALISGLTAALLYLSMQHYRVNKYISFMIITGIYIIAGSFFYDRPQLITYLGIALFVFITSIPDIDNKRLLWSIPFIMLVWANMHPGAAFGLFFLAAWALEGFLDVLKQNKKVKEIYARLIVFFISCLAAFMTPSTYRLYAFLFQNVVALGAKTGLGFINEFMPPSFSQTPVMFAGLVMFTVIVIAGLRRMPLRYVLFGLVMLPLSFDMRRMIIILLIGIAAGAGITVDRYLSVFNGSVLQRTRQGRFVVSSICILMIALMFGSEIYQYETDFTGYKGIGIQKQFYPDKAIDFILEHHIKGNIFNSTELGGAVIFLGYPRIKDFIDTRLDPERFLLSEVDSAMRNPAACENLMNKYGVAYSLIENAVPINYKKLFPSPQWHLVYFDDYVQIYVKSETGNDELIKDYTYHVFDPYSFLYSPNPLFSPDAYFTKPGLLDDLQRLVKEVPYSAYAHLAYGLALIYNNGDYDNGLRHIDRAKHMMQYDPIVLLWYGIEHGLSGDIAGMKKIFNRVNTVLKHREGTTDRDRAFVNLVMGYYYYVSGLKEPAIERLKEALRLDPDLPQAQALLNRIEMR